MPAAGSRGGFAAQRNSDALVGACSFNHAGSVPAPRSPSNGAPHAPSVGCRICDSGCIFATHMRYMAQVAAGVSHLCLVTPQTSQLLSSDSMPGHEGLREPLPTMARVVVEHRGDGLRLFVEEQSFRRCRSPERGLQRDGSIVHPLRSSCVRSSGDVLLVGHGWRVREPHRVQQLAAVPVLRSGFVRRG